MTQIDISRKNPLLGFDPGKIDRQSVPLVDLHMHTNWTDGRNTVIQMYDRAVERGLAGILFSEHGRSTSGDWFPKFAAEVRALPKFPCQAFVGVECKVADQDGNIDTIPEIVDLCDLVMASVHRFPDASKAPVAFNLIAPEAALEMEFHLSWLVLPHVNVDILGHPFGMSITRFGIIPPDEKFSALAERAAAHDVAFEINAQYHPDPWRLLGICREAKATVTFGSNAHSAEDVGKIVRVLRETH